MKKKLLTAVAVMASLCGYAQTKGTSTLGLGVNIYNEKTDYIDQPEYNSNRKASSFTLGYGLFVEDNSRIGIDLNYGAAKTNGNDIKSYGGNVTYQKYYPLVKTLYAYAGGKAGYAYITQKFENSSSSYNNSNDYSLGAYGGVTWFVSKRFAFETTLLSATASYMNSKHIYDYDLTATPSTNRQTMFNLKTEGFVNNLGFKIYLLF